MSWRPGWGAWIAAVGCAATAAGSTLRDVTPVTDQVIQLHFVDGRAILAAPGGQDRIEEAPLDLRAASRPVVWEVASRVAAGPLAWRHPVRVGRKSKGRDFVTQTAPRYRQVWTNEHWLYLQLARPMVSGVTYLIRSSVLATATGFVFDPLRTRSEAVHVNQIGYAADARPKAAYLSAWLGDLGPLDLAPRLGGRWWLVDQASGATVFEGRVAMRKRLADGPDGGQPDEPAYVRADVAECDFSGWTRTGRYAVAVEHAGCSYPFEIAADPYRAAFQAAMRGLYHQRCGIALTEPYTHWTRSACHRPETGAIRQSTLRIIDGHCDGDGCTDPRPTTETREVSGGYHDAGDWDREDWHLAVPQVLSLVVELFPDRFRDGELNLPESGNGVPDILDEARWSLDYFRRLQRPDGGVSAGMFLNRFPQPGLNAAMDTASRFCYAEDPLISFRYAAAACHFAFAVAKVGGKLDGAPYVASAERAWAWAEGHQRPGDAKLVRDDRVHAAAALFRATGDARYHEAFRRGLLVTDEDGGLWVNDRYDQQWAAWTYALTDRPETDAGLRDRLRRATIRYARWAVVEPAAKRSLRVGGNWWRPLTWGFGAAPETLPAMVAWALTRDPAFLAVMRTSADFTLGGNPLNICWITGTGARPPEGVFHPDSWYGAMGGEVCPGIVPEGPYRYEGEPAPNSGPWDPKFVEASAYPPAKSWPPLELYFAAKHCYPMNEFTVAGIANAAAAYAALCAPASP